MDYKNRSLYISKEYLLNKIDSIGLELSKAMWERDKAIRSLNTRLLPGLLNKVAELKAQESIVLERLHVAMEDWYEAYPEKRDAPRKFHIIKKGN